MPLQPWPGRLVAFRVAALEARRLTYRRIVCGTSFPQLG